MRPDVITGLLLLCACERVDPSAASRQPSHPPERAAATARAEPVIAPVGTEAKRANEPAVELAAGRELSIPQGMLRVGSASGTIDRNPSSEADDVQLEIPAFVIDALPYPNDPHQPFRAGVSRPEAEQLCRTQGKRLCHELEWERACSGDPDALYPHFREGFEPVTCANDPRTCASPFGVLSLGATAREWTANQVTEGLGDALRTAVVRGAARDAPLPAHRCAARDAATPDSRSESLVFRCCRGPTPSLTYPTETRREPFREAVISKQDLPALLATLASLKDRLQGFRPFTEREINESLQKAGSSRTRIAPWVASGGILAWSPVHGEEVFVAVGDTPQGALLVVAYRSTEGTLRLIGTFETAHEHTAIVLAYNAEAPREVLFSSCWGCGGEGGAIVFGEDARIQISPR